MAYRVCQDVKSRFIDHDAFVFSRRTGRIHAFTETGSFVWSLMWKKLSEEEIADRVVAEFEVELAQARKDVEEFIVSLHEQGLVELLDGRTDT